jgi:hypothetical protein
MKIEGLNHLLGEGVLKITKNKKTSYVLNNEVRIRDILISQNENENYHK